jgi:hypothetical protein
VKWPKKDQGVDMYALQETEDYALVSVPEAHKYIIVNQKTQHIEAEMEQLPSTLYQLEALQNALTKLRKEGKYDMS